MSAGEQPPLFIELQALIDALRGASKSGSATVNDVLRMSSQRLRVDADYAAVLSEEIRQLLANTSSTHLLTEAGVLSDVGIFSGILHRIGGRIAPAPSHQGNIKQPLVSLLKRSDERWIESLSPAALQDWINALCREQSTRWDDPTKLAEAIVILSTRIAGSGLNPRLLEQHRELGEWGAPFLSLSRVIEDYAEIVSHGNYDARARRRALDVVERCHAQVEDVRVNRRSLGTSLDLSSRTLQLLQQLQRLRLLLEVTGEIETPSTDPNEGGTEDAADGQHPVATLVVDLVLGTLRERRVLRFVLEKADLVAYLVVGHAARKGEKYVVRTAKEYRSFLIKSALAGLLVAIFACLKVELSHAGLAPVPQGLLYGANYALCFALIYLTGATLATKQPAMTASRLAQALEYNEDFALLVRATWRSQFISFVGNILGASAFAIAIVVALKAATGAPLLEEPEATKLVEQLHPWRSMSLFYAAIAGVMLSCAGFIAGFIDNAVVFHRVAERVSSGGGIFRILPGRLRRHLAARVDKEFGALSGNVLLGFMLGSAGTIGAITGLPFDIRHIAFASSHATLGIWHLPAQQTAGAITTLLAATLLIGLVNFLVSFGLTLGVAVESRKVVGVNWRQQLKTLARLALRRPFHFFFPFPEKPVPSAGKESRS